MSGKSNYAVIARYERQFWPDAEAAAGDLSLAADVKRVTLGILAAKSADDAEG